MQTLLSQSNWLKFVIGLLSCNKSTITIACTRTAVSVTIFCEKAAKIAPLTTACDAGVIPKKNPMPSHEIIEDSLKKIFSGIRQLKKALPSKEFTIDGRLVGDIGEAIVQRDYEVSLYQGLAIDYDGETPCGKKVQIKATFKNSLTFKKVPDYYLGIKIFEDGTYEEIFNGSGRVIEAEYKHRKGFGEKLLSFPNKRLCELSANIQSEQRIKRKV